MKISVIMPCYNAQRWITDALRSVAAQKYPPHEIIVVDDGSTDDSLTAIKQCGVEVTLLHTNRANGAGARNAGIEAATGDWIAFLDADDYWLEHHLQQAVDLLSDRNAVGYIEHREHVDIENTLIQPSSPWPIDKPMAELSDDKFIKLFAGYRHYFAMSSVVVNRQRLDEVGRLDAQQVRRHDIDMWLRLIAGQAWAYHPNPGSRYRIDTPGSISRALADREYWFLRALLKNKSHYQQDEMSRLINTVARRTLSAAYTDGDASDRRRANELAWAYLQPSQKAMFSIVKLWPKLFAALNRKRRRRVFDNLKPEDRI